MREPDRIVVRQTLDRLRAELLSEKTANGHWVGELAASALSTATAISALAAVKIHAGNEPNGGNPADSTPDPRCRQDQQVRHPNEIAPNEIAPNEIELNESEPMVRRGVDYLRTQQNDDGGFGDTDLSHSNIATSYLVLAASTLAEQAFGFRLADDQLRRLRDYIDRSGAVDGLRRRYGRDKTFVVPILTNLAIAGLVSWDEVQALPFEAAVFPQSMYRFLKIPVVSYAIPALVAIGQARHFHGRRAIAPVRWIRTASIKRTMDRLVEIQPSSGGYLEATPLTAFVAMSLASTWRSDHLVCRNALKFLGASIREDGSWPIDTNLATWVTSLSVHALACDPQDDGEWCDDRLVDWHLNCQLQKRHPYTGADPGGWGWTDYSGTVPDGDDTPAAMLAMKQHRKWCQADQRSRIDQAVNKGHRFLRGLQNRDGGWPTFCRGWGKLPFDRSSVDLTAHALRAIGESVDPGCQRKAIRFIERKQQPDGSWLPLWFGNQDLADESNPVYGTSRVLLASVVDRATMRRGVNYLVENQNPDGGWGGGPSVQKKLNAITKERKIRCDVDLTSTTEETALAVEALATFLLIQRDDLASQRDFAGTGGVKTDSLAGQSVPNGASGGDETNDVRAAIISGVEFLLRSVDDGRYRVAWPIGFYFAKLWYHERLYPLVFTMAALGKYLRVIAQDHDLDWPK